MEDEIKYMRIGGCVKIGTSSFCIRNGGIEFYAAIFVFFAWYSGLRPILAYMIRKIPQWYAFSPVFGLMLPFS